MMTNTFCFLFVCGRIVKHVFGQNKSKEELSLRKFKLLNSSICKFESKNLIETQKYSQLHICDCMSHSLGGRTPTWFLLGRAG